MPRTELRPPATDERRQPHLGDRVPGCVACGFTPHPDLPARSRRGMHTVIDHVGAIAVCDLCLIEAIGAGPGGLTLMLGSAVLVGGR